MSFTGSIRISELNPFVGQVSSVDFFPLVQSSSLTTFRINISQLETWLSISGSVLSASWASQSLNSFSALSASWASQSLSASYSVSSTSASFAPFTQSIQISGSWASQSLSASYATTASYSFNTISSSYAVTASYALVAVDSVPIGTIIAFATSSVPNNWLECNGGIVSTASFLQLYQAIQTTNPSATYGYLCDGFGNFNLSGSFFKLPDSRGQFFRGWDHGRGVDAGRVMASHQSANPGTHYHGIGVFTADTNDDGQFILRTWSDGNPYTIRTVPGNTDSAQITLLPNGSSDALAAMGTSNPVGSGDLYPQNISVMFCIKYSNATNFATGGVTLSGDVVGNSSNVTAIRIQTIPVTSSAPTNNQVLTYSSASNTWYPANAQTPSGISGITYWVANPLAVFGSGSLLYSFNFNNFTNLENLVQINTSTNVVTYLAQWPQTISFPQGRIFRNTVDGNLHILMSSELNFYDFNTNTNVVTQITGSGGYFTDLPVKISWASGSLVPTIWALVSQWQNSSTPIVYMNKHYWNGSSWIVSQTSLDLRNVINNTPYLSFYNYPSSIAANAYTLLWDYNFIKKRYYLIDTATSYLHIFSQNTGDIDTNFASSFITYVKSLAVPIPPLEIAENAAQEHMTVEYDPDTGQEQGIIYNRRGNVNTTGCVTRINWPEIS